MLRNSLRRLIRLPRAIRPIHQSAIRLSDEPSEKDISGSVATKFQVFRNESGIIFDIEEERRQRDDNEIENDENEPTYSPYDGLNLKRGVKGVFEIEDLVEILNREKARNLCVLKMPSDIKYVDYLCLVNGISYRHMIGMCNFVRKCYKLKRETGDIIPKIEGEKSRDWIAMDLGNIALHIFTEKSREYYDIESLWCLGEEYEKRIKDRKDSHGIYQPYLEEAARAAMEAEALRDIARNT